MIYVYFFIKPVVKWSENSVRFEFLWELPSRWARILWNFISQCEVWHVCAYAVLSDSCIRIFKTFTVITNSRLPELEPGTQRMIYRSHMYHLCLMSHKIELWIQCRLGQTRYCRLWHLIQVSTVCHDYTKTCLFKYAEDFISKNEHFQIKKILIFFLFLLKT